jgi:hypothetical protein
VVQGMHPSSLISAAISIQELMLCIIHDAIRQSPDQVCSSKPMQHNATAPCVAFATEFLHSTRTMSR